MRAAQVLAPAALGLVAAAERRTALVVDVVPPVCRRYSVL